MSGNEQVITIRGEQELVARAGHLFGTAGSEFACAATDLNTWSRPAARASMAGRVRRADGPVIRKLYTPVALADEEQRTLLLERASLGAQVRICGTGLLPHETIIIDRRVMILAGAEVAGDREFTVTTAPTLISGVYALFEATWEAATELTAYLRQDPPQVDEEGRRVLRALGEGLTDEAAARRLGLSLRTYRRRVAELMRLLDSESRFQAGVHAGELGLIP
ncbi:helix-turn-helix domain-containing protein [Actinoallomurus rhizosphaericola]|uniref:DNA-binding response regulator n=1 Tax=Actinoallomurus rhizosphaericola TaxID=2952536 RepID=UPI002092E14D|nr:DNA-binding response regulator [Actinoallomurus rhizosphaericola]MCO5998616.1 DNA-binding response regulator [Actinoallomurus rhizosphaericola]